MHQHNNDIGAFSFSKKYQKEDCMKYYVIALIKVNKMVSPLMRFGYPLT
jgi:hypothetical protein